MLDSRFLSTASTNEKREQSCPEDHVILSKHSHAQNDPKSEHRTKKHSTRNPFSP